MTKKHAAYNLTLKDFEKLELNQGYKCAICRREEKLFVDHNPTTNKVRGLLCFSCNMAIGLFYDNQSTVMSALQYLEQDV